ncbi:peptidoglycan-binding domain-containing protein [Streptomyces sp. NPDC002309]
MTKQNEHQCPECGTPRGADNTPACACGERAAEALRDARTAEQAAAEDFDPLRIRPYVALHPTHSAPPEHPEPTTPAAPGSPEALTEPVAEPSLPHDPPAPTPAPAPTPESPQAAEPEPPQATEPPQAPEPPHGPHRAAHPGPHRAPHPGRRRTILLATAAVLAVTATAGFAGGLFSYDPPARDSAAPESVREAVPQARTTPPTPTPSATAPSAAPATRSPSPTAAPSPSASPSASASATQPASPTPTDRPSSPTTPAANSPTPSDRGEPAQTLSRGDSGPEVTELQLRLRQLYLYNDDPDGDYTGEVENAVRTYQWARGIRGDELGVYGEETRRMLESETSEP